MYSSKLLVTRSRPPLPFICSIARNARSFARHETSEIPHIQAMSDSRLNNQQQTPTAICAPAVHKGWEAMYSIPFRTQHHPLTQSSVQTDKQPEYEGHAHVHKALQLLPHSTCGWLLVCKPVLRATAGKAGHCFSS